NIKPEEAVMIGDSYKNDIQPTTEIGMSAIWLKTKAKTSNF
ncbi:MAG: HAD hydrolase-like protein, partial [Prevotellaceae bacterium]|nr:HAD hydrolase-like protein [Candidatus Faecinaster equi]